MTLTVVDRMVGAMQADPAPIVFAYDGSDQAKAAIACAGRELTKDRPAIVLTVWEPFEAVPFAGIGMGGGVELDSEMEVEAGRTAEEGRALAESAGFRASALAERGVPTWRRIVEVCDELEAALIITGSRGRSGVKAVLLGSVTEAVSRHCQRPVLVVH